MSYSANISTGIPGVGGSEDTDLEDILNQPIDPAFAADYERDALLLDLQVPDTTEPRLRATPRNDSLAAPLPAHSSNSQFSDQVVSSSSNSGAQGFVVPIVDLTKGKMHEIPRMMQIYNTYNAEWADPSVTIAAHKSSGCLLAEHMLKHFFPPSQRFLIKQTEPNTATRNGWSIEMKNLVNMNDYRNEQGQPKSIPNFRLIPAEAITGYTVYKYWDLNDGTEKPYPHLYLTVIADPLTDYAEWQEESKAVNTPADIMAYAMGTDAKIRIGQVIVIMGPHVAFYKYDQRERGPLKEDATEEQVIKHDKLTRPFDTRKPGWMFDMRTAKPADVQRVFERVAATKVYYQNGFEGDGSSTRKSKR